MKLPLITRRSLLRLGLAGCAGLVPYGYGATRGRTSLVIEQSDCPLPLPVGETTSPLDGLKIAVMADFHFDETHDHALVASAVALCNQQKPDVVLLPGDFVSHDAAAMRPLVGELQHLRAPLGVFASSGNHDHWSGIEVVRDALAGAGIELLRNRARIVEHRAVRLAIVGLDSAWGGHPDYPLATRDVPADVPRILSMHEPDYFDHVSRAAPSHLLPLLQVSGHTHGGQVCAPLIGPLILPSWGKKYPAGWFGASGHRLYVTRGIGTIGPAARFLCRPEISMITLCA